MARSPINPHFFQPLLPGFQNQINIPVAFFSKYIEGRIEQKKAKLRSDCSDKTWVVKMEGRRFTNGWEDFAYAHDLRIGDVIIFRHEGELVFHVTACGRSCCEIDYISSHNIDDDHQDKIEIRPLKKRAKKNLRIEEESSSRHPCFAGSVPPSSLHMDALYLPKEFVRSNGLNEKCSEMVLMNENGGTWNLDLRHYKSNNTSVIARGWKSFCKVKKLKARDPFRFKLVGTREKPVLRLCHAESNRNTRLVELSEGNDVKSLSTESNQTEESEEKSIQDKRSLWKYLNNKSKKKANRFVTLAITRYCVKSNKLRLPIRFTRVSRINKAGKIALLGKDGVKWMVHIAKENARGVMRLGRDWQGFCDVHGVKIGESFVLELIKEKDGSLVLKFCTKVNCN